MADEFLRMYVRSTCDIFPQPSLRRGRPRCKLITTTTPRELSLNNRVRRVESYFVDCMKGGLFLPSLLSPSIRLSHRSERLFTPTHLGVYNHVFERLATDDSGGDDEGPLIALNPNFNVNVMNGQHLSRLLLGNRAYGV